MRRSAILLFFLLILQMPSLAQNLTMSLKGEVTSHATDLDAKTYYPVLDQNDNLCALIKVTVTNPLKNPLSLSVGGLSVIKREEKEDGEIWFYIPAQVKNLHFSCLGYSRMPAVPVNLKAGTVYRLTIASDAVFTTVTTAKVNSNFLKMQVTPPDAVIRLGETKNYEITSEMLVEGNFVRKLDYGTYYYRIEHSLYEPKEGTVTVSASNRPVVVNLDPAYNTVTVTSTPENGASVFIDDEFKGNTPLTLNEKLKKGERRIRLMHKDYHQYDGTITLSGDGSRRSVTIDLSPQYGTVTCKSEDPSAEIWVDQDYKGLGSWTGRLSSNMTHVLEARKANHQSQSKSFSVEDGQVKSESVGAPVPLYASLSVVTDPLMSKVYIDGKFAGDAPLLTQVLMGEHKLMVTHDGYVSDERIVTLAHNEEKEVTVTLSESRVYVPVTVTTDSDADIYVDGERKTYGKGTWTGQLSEGVHTFTSTKSYHNDGRLTYTVKGPSRVKVTIPSPTPQKANINVRANMPGVSVYVDDSYVGRAPYSGQVNAGERKISVTKSKFRALNSPETVVLNANETEYLNFEMKKDWSQSWLLGPQKWCTNFGELQYGLGIPDDDDEGVTHYVGLEYSYVSTGLGFRASAMYGVNSGEILGTVGPAFRITPSYSDLDLQFYAGIGGGYAPFDGFSSETGRGGKFSMAYDAGFRFAFEHPNLDYFCWYSFSAGAKYFNHKIIPTFGVSLFPGGIFRSDGLYEEQYDFSRTFLDCVFGFGTMRDTYHFGLTFAHVKTRIGYYTTVMYELDDIGSLAVGPVFRLTGDSSFLDLQLYGGIGLNASSYYGTSFLGDTGFRFSWRSHSGLGLWNFNLGCMFFGDEVVPTIGVGLGISLVALAGLAGAVAAM